MISSKRTLTSSYSLNHKSFRVSLKLMYLKNVSEAREFRIEVKKLKVNAKSKK